MKSNPRTVDDYLAAAPAAAQPMLTEIRSLIRAAAPHATERISYGMPTYDQDGRLCHFAGYEKHVAVYGLIHVESALAEEAKDLLDHRSTLRIPIGQPVPAKLITKGVKARLKANREGTR